MGVESLLVKLLSENGLATAFGFVLCFLLIMILKWAFKQQEHILRIAQDDRKQFLDTIHDLRHSIDENTKACVELCYLHKK